jgi:hypothetical protein
MVADLKKKGAPVPAEIIGDLKSARTLIKILRADPSCGQNAQKIDEILTNVESFLVSEGQRRFGQAYVDEWLRRANEAGRRIVDGEDEETRFVVGMHGEQAWVRLTPSDEMPLKKLKSLAEQSNLKCRVQDEYLVVLGSDAALKDFVKKIAEKYRPKPKKEQ